MNVLTQAILSRPSLIDADDPLFARALRAIRTHLGMDVAFISEFAGGRRHFRHIDASRPDGLIQVDGSDPLEDSYCLRVVDGRLPELMPDACANPEALTIAATRALPVGAHLSVPIRLSDGRVFGTFCCFSSTSDYTLNERDLNMMRAFAEVVAEQVEKDLHARERLQEAKYRIDSVMGTEALTSVYQPIFNVPKNQIVGFEALARFSEGLDRPPDVWLAEAATLGRRMELEILAMRTALRGLDKLPKPVYLSVNASPATIVNGRLEELLSGVALDRVIVEVTEHEAVDRYGDLAAAVRPLQRRGLRLAIDDAGAGYASFRHILNLAPHMIKLDVSITRDVDTDRSRRALAAALCRFAHETDCRIVAEGVETASEMKTLSELGFSEAQGFFLGRPAPIEQAAALCE